MRGFSNMSREKDIEQQIRKLELEIRALRMEKSRIATRPTTVIVPEDQEEIFLNVEKRVEERFSDIHFDPESGEITVFGERYVLFRAGSVSHEFLNLVKERYSDYPEHEAVSIGNNFLYDNAKVLGKKDATAFHKRMKLEEPIERLAAGPVHFALTGWANVEIFEDSNPVPNNDYFLHFQHHNSFEAQSWIKEGKTSDIPVCTMNCGYSAGWCEETFGIPLTTVEVTCEAKGDDACTFIMAPTSKIQEYVEQVVDLSSVENFEIPVFFKRKYIEEKLKDSLHQKELLIKEVHHRVKNNLQVITSLLRLQMDRIEDESLKSEFMASINRVKTMAVVHEMMYSGKSIDSISMLTYFRELSSSLVQSYALDPTIKIDIDIDIEDVEFDLERSIPLALIMNEITCNAFKHGLRKNGNFYISLRQKSDKCYLLRIGDDGIGLIDYKSDDGLGMTLIEILCDQLNAELEINNSDNGLEYKISFCLPE